MKKDLQKAADALLQLVRSHKEAWLEIVHSRYDEYDLDHFTKRLRADFELQKMLEDVCAGKVVDVSLLQGKLDALAAWEDDLLDEARTLPKQAFLTNFAIAMRQAESAGMFVEPMGIQQTVRR